MSKPSRRIKSVPCALCGEETKDVDAVCRDCRQQWKDGKLYYAKVQSGEAVEWPVATYWHLYHFLGDPEKEQYSHDSDIVREVRACVLALADVREVEGRKYISLGSQEKTPVIGAGQGFNEGYDKFTGPREKFEIVLRLVQAIRDYVACEYRTGLNEGERFVQKLAMGTMSMDDLHKRESQRASAMQSGRK